MNTEPKQRDQEELPPSLHDVAILPVTPNIGDNDLTTQLFKAFEDAEAKAIVLIGYATGTTPSGLNPHIKKAVDEGVPVFILSANPGESHGPRRIVYATQQAAVEAGATPLKDVNVNHTEEVALAIQAEVDSGKTGAELTQAIVEKYGTPTKEAA